MVRVLGLLLAGIVSLPCPRSFAQVADGAPGLAAGLPSKSNQSLANEAELRARAAEIRAAFVHRYGTQEEIQAFDHPGAVSASAKRPKIPKPSDLEPVQIFDQIFHRVEYQKDREGIERVQAAVIGTHGTSTGLRELERFVPFGDLIFGIGAGAGAQREAALAQLQASGGEDQEYFAATSKALSSILTKEEQVEYGDGDYRTRARLLFKAGLNLLERAGRRMPSF